MDHREPNNSDFFANANAAMMTELIATITGGTPNPTLTLAVNDVLEKSVQAALADERDRCLRVVESMEPVMNANGQPDLRATLRAAATLIRLGF